MFQCPYANVAGAQVNLRLVTGYFEVSTGGMQNMPKSFWSNDKGVSAEQERLQERQACEYGLLSLISRLPQYNQMREKCPTNKRWNP